MPQHSRVTTNELGWSSVQCGHVWREESSLQLSEYVIPGKETKSACCAAELRSRILFTLTDESAESQIEVSTQELPLGSAERDGLI